jgi:hypothetical protein
VVDLRFALREAKIGVFKTQSSVLWPDNS